jgi:glycosyltransferase involved in cell wall biosynthesis
MTLTIITINYNNADGLRKTMESVLSQTSRDFEYIVIDGGSTDGSVEIIQTFKLSNFQTFNYISEPDKGIYHAMNKGIKMANGEYVQFLNSGDWLVDKNVVGSMLEKLPHCDLFIGRKLSIKPNGKIRVEKQSTDVSFFTFYRSTLQHTSAYIRRELFDRYGMYDETLKIVSDWKWYIIVVGLSRTKVEFTDICVSYFDMTGISSINRKLEMEERRKVLEELIPAPILDDYDKYCFDIVQMERIKKHQIVYSFFWLIERVLFKFEKWKIKYIDWR